MIKLIDLLKEVQEARLAGDWNTGKPPKLGKLYHNTTFGGILGILKDGLVLKRHDGICFSRAKRFMKNSEVRLIVDGQKLSQKYDVEPYDWGGDTNEWEERCVNTEKADVSDCTIKVLLNPKEESPQEVIDQLVSVYEKEHERALKNWPKQKAHLIKVGYSPKKYWNDDANGLKQTPEEYRAELETLPHLKKRDPFLPEIIKILKEKNIPYEITDNFPAAS